MLDKTHSGTINGWPEQIPDRPKNVDGQFLAKQPKRMVNGSIEGSAEMSVEIGREHLRDCAIGTSVSDATTSYSVYNEEVKVRTQINWMDSLFPPLPNRRYDILYADPPWYYNGKLQFDKSGTAEKNHN